MHIIHTSIRKGGIAVLFLSVLFALTGCVTLDPAQQSANFEKEVKAALQQTDIQTIRAYAVANTKCGYVSESGEFSAWGWPGSTYFGDKLFANVQLADVGFTGKRMVTGSIDTGDIRSVTREKSSEGYDAIILNMDDNIRYYIIPFGAANVTPFGELKDYVAFTKEQEKYQNTQCVDLLMAKLANVASPRPVEAGPQLIDKDPSQFLKEAKSVEGVLEEGWNRVGIDGKAISLILEIREIKQPSKSTLWRSIEMAAQMQGKDLSNPFAAKNKVPMIGYYKAKENLNVMEKLSLQIPLQVISPGKFGFVVEGVVYAATIVHAKDGSWRYRVQIPEPIQ